MISLFLCFSNLISSFKACSWSLTFNSCSFCFWFAIEIFSNLSSSCFSNFNLLVSSFLSILYWSIVLAILSKKPFIYFSIFKLILKLNWGFKEFWKFINFSRKVWSIEVLLSLTFIFLVFLKIFFVFFFNLRFTNFFFFCDFFWLNEFNFFNILFWFFIFFWFFFCFFHL